MLTDDEWPYEITETDETIFQALVPRDHPLVLALSAINWRAFEQILAEYYSADVGQPAIKPVFILKLIYLSYQYNLSDRQVVERAKTDLAFRYFLNVGMRCHMPHPTTLIKFRGRVGKEGFERIFAELVSQAREAGLVKDRLRLKDASHVVANIAIPTTLTLLAQIRDQLLKAAQIFDPEAIAGFRIRIDWMREQTRPDEQLEARVQLLQDILDYVQQISAPEDAASNRDWQRLSKMAAVARKILYEQQNPEAKQRTLSVVDPEARRGKHGHWYEGYVLDISMDADSELITQINVLDAGGNEAEDAIELIKGEEKTHGNDIESLSMDGAGFNGDMLRTLEDPKGLAIQTFVPPKQEPETDLFRPADFQLSNDQQHVTCPAGQTSKYRQQDEKEHGWIFRFTREQCDDCPLVAKCMTKPKTGKFGRVVRKNNYETEYQRARERALTEEFLRVRKEHPKVERKINDIMRHHGGRRARYWGKTKVMCQQYMTCFAVNVKRFVALMRAPAMASI